MAGRSGIGGRSRRRSGLADALIDAGLMAAPPAPRTWRELVAGLTVCDEVTPTLAGVDIEPWEDGCPASDGLSNGS